MIHYLYKTTRQDGKYYIGVHSTSVLDDGYLGSGKYLLASVKKHGVSFHTKTILESFESRKLALIAERETVTANLLQDALCMNISLGGNGGNLGVANGFFGKKHSKESLELIVKKSGHAITEEQRQWMSNKFLDVKLSQAHKKNLSISNRGKKQNHSQESIDKREAAKRKPVLIEGIQYESIKEAAASLGVYRGKISRMLKRN